MSNIGLNNRQLALKLIEEVIKSKAFFEDVLANHSEYEELDQKDKNFIFKLCHDVFVFFSAYSRVIKRYIPNFLKRNLTFRILMVMALVEKKHFLSPDYAIVNDAAEITKNVGLDKLTGMVNATLKKIFKEQTLDEKPRIFGSFREFLKQYYGEKDIRDLESVLQVRPPLDVTIDDAFDSEFTFKKLLHDTARFDSEHSPLNIIKSLPNSAWVQDVAAANILANIKSYLKHKRVLDCCAAPGGKTRQLLAYGADVVAIDKSPYRIERLEENLEKADGSYQVLCQDLLAYMPKENFDVVILDAPCSATGTIRKHPELQYLKGQASVATLLKLQDQLLERATGFLNPGGILVYAVCSLNPEEGKLKIKSFLEKHSEFSLMDIKGQNVKKGFYQTFPWLMKEEGSMDGFFATYLQKEK